MTNVIMAETSVTLRFLQNEVGNSHTTSDMMRAAIIYLATHPINAHSWNLAGYTYEWPKEDVFLRVNRYVEKRLAELNGEVNETTFKGVDLYDPDCLHRVVNRLQEVIKDWEENQNSLYMAEVITTTLACYRTTKEVDRLLRDSLMAPTCNETVGLLKEIISILKGERKMETSEKVLALEAQADKICDDVNRSIGQGENVIVYAHTAGEIIDELIRDYIIENGMNQHSHWLVDARVITIEGRFDYDKVIEKVLLIRRYVEKRFQELEKEEPMAIEETTECIVEEKEEFMNNEVEMVTCEWCCTQHPINECTQLRSGEYVCDDCRENHYYTCDECGELHSEEEDYWIDGEEISVCDRCFDRRFATCEGCGYNYRIDNMTESDNGDYYCEACYDDRFAACDNCGCEVYRDDAHWTNNDEYLCDSCYERYLNNQVIHSYHDDDVEYGLLTFADEPVNKRTVTIGIEHEVGGDKMWAKGFLDIVNKDAENVVLMRDSSVDGFEIVSMPMTLNYFKYKFVDAYEKGLEYLREHHFRGENAGGIHIHFNEIDNPMQLARLCNILYGSIDDVDAWTKITRRDRYELNSWCSMTDRAYTTTQILSGGYMTASRDRHTALNYDGDRTGTHELRIFNSTVDMDTYKGCVDILLSLLTFTEYYDEKGAFVTTRDYVNWVKEERMSFPLAYDAVKKTFEMYGIDEPAVEVELPVDTDEFFIDDEDTFIDELVRNIDWSGIDDITLSDIDEGEEMIERHRMAEVG